PAWARGYNVRPYQWEFSSGVHQQLMPNLSVGIDYFRRIYGNFLTIYNTSVTPADYDPYSITAPVDPRLPNGGGYVIGGLYDLNPTKVGALTEIGTSSNTFGDQLQHWNGIDVNLTARRKAILFQGGLSTGKTVTDNCQIVTKANSITTATGA